MEYSKLFLGLPELTNEIIKYFRNDFSTLHSCMLVNRLWCRLTIPLLWEDPFSIPTENYHFIYVYLNNLNQHDKLLLKEYGIKSNSFLTNNNSTLFNYPYYIKYLNTWKIIESIEKWVKEVKIIKYQNDINLIRLIYKSLFKVFIENEVILNTFEIEMDTNMDYDYFNVAFELILNHPGFINNIKILKLYFGDLTRFDNLLSLLSNCNTVSSIYLKCQNIIIEKFLSKIIISQNNLQKISFFYNNLPLYHTLLSLKNSNCSNTLTNILFYHVDFKNIFIFNQVFENLNNLKSIHIIYCLSLNSNFIDQIIGINKPFKLTSLFLDDTFQNNLCQIDTFKLFFQKCADYLENFGFNFNSLNDELRRELLEQVLNYCTKIKFFESSENNHYRLFLSFDIIENIFHYLNYLTISSKNINNCSIILHELGQILPLKLDYLNLVLTFDENDFEIFLKNSQNIFIKKLLISNNYYGNVKRNILPFIEKYIMKKKRVKYLAFKDMDDLFYMKDKVEEFKSFDIEIQDYDILITYCYEYIEETY
ncbi:hypothetical protein RclHR1_05220012 [Rhizophagus clarus]|uniref:F-box domain-containing protein n=1 Tax=Rhizophagus clarus TaxID=94130 RepID=A0A2Z6RYY2_9GLOM|nr:hypothetical protein RclHR1_05220012 [Rhizophagus clarus]